MKQRDEQSKEKDLKSDDWSKKASEDMDWMVQSRFLPAITRAASCNVLRASFRARTESSSLSPRDCAPREMSTDVVVVAAPFGTVFAVAALIRTVGVSATKVAISTYRLTTPFGRKAPLIGMPIPEKSIARPGTTVPVTSMGAIVAALARCLAGAEVGPEAACSAADCAGASARSKLRRQVGRSGQSRLKHGEEREEEGYRR